MDAGSQCHRAAHCAVPSEYGGPVAADLQAGPGRGAASSSSAGRRLPKANGVLHLTLLLRAAACAQAITPPVLAGGV